MAKESPILKISQSAVPIWAPTRSSSASCSPRLNETQLDPSRLQWRFPVTLCTPSSSKITLLLGVPLFKLLEQWMMGSPSHVMSCAFLSLRLLTHKVSILSECSCMWQEIENVWDIIYVTFGTSNGPYLNPVWVISEGHNLIMPDCQMFMSDYFGGMSRKTMCAVAMTGHDNICHQVKSESFSRHCILGLWEGL